MHPSAYADVEGQHVHRVYDAIAPHFSDTRYKTWPVVDRFLQTMPDYSIGADVGCGNGKYLGVNPNLYISGSDRSAQLSRICHSRGHECLICDTLSLPYRECLDFVISIAVIHHLSTPERRVSGVRELIRVLRPGGKLLVFVWALEQGGKRKFEQQDVFVPWTLPTNRYPTTNVGSDVETIAEGSAAPKLGPVVYDRYYHVFRKGELESVVEEAGGGFVVESGYDRDNWYVVVQKGI